MKELIVFICGMFLGGIAGITISAIATISKREDESICRHKPPDNWVGEEPVKLEDSDEFKGFM